MKKIKKVREIESKVKSIREIKKNNSQKRKISNQETNQSEIPNEIPLEPNSRSHQTQQMPRPITSQTTASVPARQRRTESTVQREERLYGPRQQTDDNSRSYTSRPNATLERPNAIRAQILTPSSAIREQSKIDQREGKYKLDSPKPEKKKRRYPWEV